MLSTLYAIARPSVRLSFRQGTLNNGGEENKPFSSFKRQYLENANMRYVQTYY